MRESKFIQRFLGADHIGPMLKRLLLLVIVVVWGYIGWLRYYGGGIPVPSFAAASGIDTLYNECANTYGLQSRGFRAVPVSELNSNDRDGLLECAVEMGNPAFLKWVLTNVKGGFSIRKGGDYLAKVAAWKDAQAALEVLQLLAGPDSGVKLNESFNDIVAAARDAATVDVARYLLDGHPQLIKETNEQLLWGIGERLAGMSLAQHQASKGRIDVAEYFAVSGSIVAKPGFHFRHWVLKNNRAQLLDRRFDDFLVKHGVSRDEENDKGLTVLHEAVLFGDHELVSGLLLSGASPNTTDRLGDTPLHDAIKRNSGKIVLLLASRAEVNAANRRGRTPLHEAIANGSWDAASALLDNGARSDIRDAEGRTANFDCVAHNCPHLDRLVAMGADLGARDNNLNTLLHAVAGQESGGVGVAQQVLSRGVALDAKNSSGDTALHLAAASGNEPIVRLLVGQGASTNERNNSGDSPLHLSEEAAVIAALLDGGANPDLANRAGVRPVDGGIERTLMLFHSPSLIGAKSDSIPKHFKSIGAIADDLEQGVELATPKKGSLHGLSFVDGDYEPTAVTFAPRAANLEYTVQLACEGWLTLSIGDRAVDLVNSPIRSEWEPLVSEGSDPHTFRVTLGTERCSPASKLPAILTAAASQASGTAADQWAVASRLCIEQISNDNATGCELHLRPILKVLVLSGKKWQEAGILHGATATK